MFLVLKVVVAVELAVELAPKPVARSMMLCNEK